MFPFLFSCLFSVVSIKRCSWKKGSNWFSLILVISLGHCTGACWAFALKPWNCLLFWVESVAQVRRIIVQILYSFSILGPDCLCLLWEIPACYFPVVIYSLLFPDNSLLCRKIVNFFLIILTNNRLFCDITGCYLKIASCRWLQRFCLLFSKKSILDDQGLS